MLLLEGASFVSRDARLREDDRHQQMRAQKARERL